MRRLVLPALLTASLAAGIAAPAALASVGEIVFAAADRQGSEIYAVGDEGGREKQLTERGHNSEPSFAIGRGEYPAEGRPIVFVSDRDGDREIFLMHADGSGQRPLTANHGLDFEPAISYDGTEVAWVTRVGGPGLMVAAPGAEPRRLTSERGDLDPTFAPDGETIAFSRDGDIFTIAVDGGGLERLTHSPGRAESSPVWIGKVIVFQSGSGDAARLLRLDPASGDTEPMLRGPNRPPAGVGDREPGGAPPRTGNFVFVRGQRLMAYSAASDRVREIPRQAPLGERLSSPSWGT